MSTQIFLSETRERFLKAILAQLPVERVRELFVFQPIKQGGVESGVAVVAGWPEGVGEGRSAAGESAAGEHDAASDTEPTSEVDSEPTVHPVDDVPAAPLETVTGEGAAALACEIPSAGGDDAPPSTDRLPPTEEEKYIVYTARYRLVLKGPDRGRWEASLVAEAEAPLLSIESVVRGVQRRSGDVDPPDRMTADDLRAALRLDPRASDAA